MDRVEEHVFRALADTVPRLKPWQVLRPVKFERGAAHRSGRVRPRLAQGQLHPVEAIESDPAAQRRA
jgi:hypothetical protein